MSDSLLDVDFTVSWTGTRDAPWSIASASIFLRQPGGAPFEIAIDTPIPTPAAPTQTISGSYIPSSQGVYFVRYIINDGAQTKYYDEKKIATRSDVVAELRNLISIRKGTEDSWLVSAMQRLELDFPCIGAGGYAMLSEVDAYAFEDALPYMAAYLASGSPATVAGVVTKIRVTNITEKTFADPTPSPETREGWLKLANMKMRGVACVSESLEKRGVANPGTLVMANSVRGDVTSPYRGLIGRSKG